MTSELSLDVAPVTPDHVEVVRPRGRSLTAGIPWGPRHRHGEELPLAWHALQDVTSAVLEMDPGASDEILHRSRDQHLARGGEGGDARSDVDGDSCDLVADGSRVNAYPAGSDRVL